MKAFLMGAVTVSLLLVACSKDKTAQKPPLTERQRDSTIAASKLPGAGVVGKALEQSDSAKARAAREDAVTP